MAACIATLEALRDVDPDDPAYVAVERAAAHLRKTAKKRRRVERQRDARTADRAELAHTGRVQAYYGARGDAPALGARMLRNQRRCYVCKQPYRRVHGFYHMLCTACAERNFAARGDSVDLTGRRAIVTGGRVKIGCLAAIGLLRAGASVTITTRFPRDAEERFAACADLEGHRDRLSIVGLDFLDLRGVLAWIERELARGEPLDILVNNAAQTVRRPPAYYAALAAAERGELPPALEEAHALLFPPRLDEEGKPVDLRPINSWTLDAAGVEPVELVEVHLVNAMVPFLLAQRLRPLMVKSTFRDRYIVNVSAMEGVFAYANKQARHPHTNMAKAALNMFTRTSAQDYVADGIYMNSVDTGWITQENPEPKKVRLESAGFCPPLDVVDGAARVLAPILRGVRGAPIAGAFFKDYEPAPW
ncbi:MAG: SDR family NAD(P)-dependent oxidoreductase [Deltaproteobacteria bacterium]|nr:SDR family NAD(P)-dependent oxidoreductase [Deltaproteobacteria bacterium]